jgi:hypothetical protein
MYCSSQSFHRCILLLEDLDAPFTQGTRHDSTSSEANSDSTLSLSGLLNCLDGVSGAEGRCVLAFISPRPSFELITYLQPSFLDNQSCRASRPCTDPSHGYLDGTYEREQVAGGGYLQVLLPASIVYVITQRRLVW